MMFATHASLGAMARTPPVKATAAIKSKGDFCYGLPGAIAPAGNFDPAGFTADLSESEVLRWREAEVTHGRVGMLASAGFLVQESFHPLFTADGGPAIEQIPKLPPALWFFMATGIGICEALRIQKGWANPYEGAERSQNEFQLKPEYYPGDLAFDPLGLAPEDPVEFRKMQERELSHGRLAMFAAAGFLAQETVTGTTWAAEDSIFERLVLGGWLDKAAIDGATASGL